MEIKIARTTAGHSSTHLRIVDVETEGSQVQASVSPGKLGLHNKTMPQTNKKTYIHTYIQTVRAGFIL
jgi:hypothetical protein